MIAHIHGKLVEKTPTHIIIDCGGIGYHVNISLHTYSLLPNTDFIKVYTYLQIKEDAHTLFGFIEKSEREIFKLLLSVSGIGASIARTMLSSLDPKQVINAIASSDVVTIQSVKGIGSKTAQRVILDLKEKVLKLYDLDEATITLKTMLLYDKEILKNQRKELKTQIKELKYKIKNLISF